MKWHRHQWTKWEDLPEFPASYKQVKRCDVCGKAKTRYP